MSKYEPLHAYLAGLDDDRWRASFADVETILGFPLPDSARTHAAWWSNSKQSSAAAWVWLDQGWRTEKLDLVAGRVTFWRGGVAPTAPNRLVEPTPPTANSLETIEHVDLSLCLDWLALGAVTLDDGGRLEFPTAARLPAIYRFTIRHPGGKEARYVGEAVDLARRVRRSRRACASTPSSRRRWRPGRKSASPPSWAMRGSTAGRCGSSQTCIPRSSAACSKTPPLSPAAGRTSRC